MRDFLLAVDPGLRGAGVALFNGRELVNATWVENPVSSGRGPKVWAPLGRNIWLWSPGALVSKLALEMPQVYPGMPKTDHNDLLDLAGVLGCVVTQFSMAEVAWFFPATWKGQVPKEIMNKRVKERLSMGEARKIVHKGALDHNTYDAIGIGMYYLGRLE